MCQKPFVLYFILNTHLQPISSEPEGRSTKTHIFSHITNYSILTLVNSKGETALLLAARHGHSETVKSLLTFSKNLEGEDPKGQRRITKEMMGMANEKKDTAFLEAVRYNHLSVLNLLLEEEPKLADVVNESMETPLYLAAEKDHHELVEETLKTCEFPAYTGPGGKIGLHAAAIRCCISCTTSLLSYIPESLLLKKTDECGWTPLQYAAYCGHTTIVSMLLDRDSSTAYISAIEDEKPTALHLAANQGKIEVMEEILSRYPDCWEVVNSRNQNILHLPVQSSDEKATQYILKQPWFGMLINEKDIDKNTPLHLLCAFEMDMPKLITDCAKKSCRNVVTNDPKNSRRWNEDHVQRLLQQTRKDTLHGRTEWMEKYNNQYTSNVIVASLIATVAFAAGFTVPGGYNGNEGPEQGMAILARKAAFKAFLITDIIALISSTFALFLYLYSSHMTLANWNILSYSCVYAFLLNNIALAAMVLAIVSGTIAVLQHSHALVVSIYVLSSIFLFIIHQLLSKYFMLFTESTSTGAYFMALCTISLRIVLQVFKSLELAWQGIRRSCNK
ncbi:hypothetical protein NMG60_11032051 [Bertholletia excelsa]